MKSLFAFALVTLYIQVLSGTSPKTVEFAVDTTTDFADASPGDGRCQTEAGSCSLRAAIQEANAVVDENTIHIPAGTYQLTLTGADEDAAATGDLDVTASVDIIGAGAGSTIIDGMHSDRVFDITVSKTETRPRVLARISGVTITNGFASDRIAGTGGGIRVTGELELRDASVTHNEASTYGGGIAGGYSMAIENVVLANNKVMRHVFSSGGGALHVGGDNRSLSIRNSSIHGNESSGRGGGIYVEACEASRTQAVLEGLSVTGTGPMPLAASGRIVST